MGEIVSRCGFRCDQCLAYRPNAEANPVGRQELSDGWHKYFGFRIPAEEIICDGCLAESPRLIDKACPVRPCVIERGFANCGSAQTTLARSSPSVSLSTRNWRPGHHSRFPPRTAPLHRPLREQTPPRPAPATVLMEPRKRRPFPNNSMVVLEQPDHSSAEGLYRVCTLLVLLDLALGRWVPIHKEAKGTAEPFHLPA